MSDSQRNMLLRGLMSQAGEKQVECVCTALNLRRVEDGIYPEALSNMYATKTRRSKPVGSKDGRQAYAGVDRGIALPGISNSIAPTRDDLPFDISQHAHPHHPGTLNVNLYIKLLNTSSAASISDFLSRSSADMARAFLPFLIARVQKFQTIFAFLQRITEESDHEKVMMEFLRCILECVSGRDATVYRVISSAKKPTDGTVPDNTNTDLSNDAITASVLSSTWQTAEARLPLSSLCNGVEVLVNGSSSNVHNVKSSDLYTDAVDTAYSAIQPECIFTVPVFGEGHRICGAIEIVNKTKGSPFFDAEDEVMLMAMSSVCTLLMKHLDSEQEGGQKNHDIKTLLETASLMSSDLDMGDLTKVIMRTAQDLLSAERCSLFMVDKERKELWSTVAHGTGEIRIPITKGIAGHVATTGQVLNIPNAYNDHRFNKAVDTRTGFRTRNILCMPMLNAQGEIIGVTQVMNKKPDTIVFTKEDEMLLASFSALAAETIEKSVMFKALQLQLTEARHANLALNQIFESITSLVMTLDKDGRLITINHPQTPAFGNKLTNMKKTSCENWLKPSEALLSDIRRAYRSFEPVFAYNYELNVGGTESWNVNYAITQLIENGVVTGAVLTFEEIDRPKLVSSTLSRYMPPDIVQRVLDESPAALQGIRQRGTILHANLRNFAPFSDTAEGPVVVNLVNEYYTAALKSVQTEAGIFENYTGESGIRATFGLPFSSGDDAERAVRCALEMRNRVDELRRRERSDDGPALKLSVGIATGQCLGGLLGSERRKVYGTLGDTVNTTAMIEAATDQYGAPILICERTRAEVKDCFHIREIDTLPIKGRDDYVTIFEILGAADEELEQNILTSLICFELGLTEYRARNWPAALGHFKKGVQLIDDAPSKLFVDRCRAIAEGQVLVPEDWDGVWRWGDVWEDDL